MTRRPASERRGQPILALVVVLMVWTLTRVALWNPVFEVRRDRLSEAVPLPASAASAPRYPALIGPHANVKTTDAFVPVKLTGAKPKPAAALSRKSRERSAGQPIAAPAFFLAPNQTDDPAEASGPVTTMDAAQPGKEPVRKGGRWSFDQWLLLRAPSSNVAQAPGAASYGASQAGAVARFRLGNGQVHDSYGYLRSTLAIKAPGRDKEIALGFGLRPVRRLPMRVLAEARLYDSKGSPVRLRPVVTVITELPWQNLPQGFRAEAYGQAGYAGGTGATAFFDAQAVVDHSIAKAVGISRDVRIGAGAWAGGQKDAVRLDVGPRVSVPLDLGGGGTSRIALDWRLRVAGNAMPASGPALTVASSF